MDNQTPFTTEEKEKCLSVLRKLARNPDLANEELEMKTLIAKIYKKARRNKRNASQKAVKANDFQKKSKAFIFQTNDERNEISERLLEQEHKNNSLQELQKSKDCYICKKSHKVAHYFYHELCPTCAEFNLLKRNQTSDLIGRIALLTGGRKKIGLAIGLKLLRAGAELIITTRFPNNAWLNYSKEKDFSTWKNRLHIYGLDLRNSPGIEQFTDTLNDTFSHLDIIINNAAQTVKRPAIFYQHLLAVEEHNYLLEAEKANTNLIQSDVNFPQGQFDKDRQQVDLRVDNSWVTKLEEVTTLELLEVQLVNSIAPFLLNSRLKGMLEKSMFKRKFIVNVSAVEGQFERTYKSSFHPHTNMAKAALNMMTRTSAQDYAKSNIYMTSVDTGWITDENPHPKKERMRNRGFVPPLDLIDGAARVLAPIFEGLNDEKEPYFGVFLKDYFVTKW
jgi:NAD(P)-dependent dehydrogenase (short-subunit alcohol dehydrogenase family)